MFKNFHLKLFALLLATIFWVFVVSLENTFYQFPGEVPIRVFNQSQELALASELGTVRLIIRMQDPVIARTLSPGDFEAYVDLRNVGAGTRSVPVLVTAKHAQVSVVRVEPSDVEITLEPVREKVLSLSLKIDGEPANGFRIENVKLSRNSITVEGAESILKKISEAKAEVHLDGKERENIVKPAAIKIYSLEGEILEGIKILQSDVSAKVSIVETVATKEVGIKVRITGKLANGVVSKIEVEPALVSISGAREAIETIERIETESIDLKDVSGSFEKTVRLAVPKEISLGKGEKPEAKVKITIDKL